PNNIILTKSKADKYFPGEDPIGQILKFNNRITLSVVAVIPDLPVTTDFPFVMFISYPTLKDFTHYDISRWGTTVSQQNLYVLLPDGVKAAELEPKINQALVPLIPNDQRDL